jgi:endonuclease/exonuclease/phosphatase family metal-dependent hydrolase
VSAMRDFCDFISKQGLMNFPLAGGSYTWSTSCDPLVWSRIDRFLVSPDWEARFPVASQKRLTCLYSDHFPILLDCDLTFARGRPFKFENVA